MKWEWRNERVSSRNFVESVVDLLRHFLSVPKTSFTSQDSTSQQGRLWNRMTGWKDTRPSAQDPETRFESPPDPLILRQLHDAHCHPGDDQQFEPGTFQSLDTGKFVSLFHSSQVSVTSFNLCPLSTQCVMSSSLSNQERTKHVYKARPNDTIPCFGKLFLISHLSLSRL